MAALTLLCCGLLLLWGEKNSWSGGTGATPYAIWLQDLGLPDPPDEYSIQRMLPTSILVLLFKTLDIRPEARQVVLAYGSMNLVLALTIPYLWTSVARELRLSPSGRWLGFAVLVANHFVLKWSFYFTAQVDMWAYVSGLGMLCFYLRERPLLLTGTTVASAFVWPTSIYLGALLLSFPRRGAGTQPDEPTPVEPPRFPFHVLAAAAAAATLLWLIYEGHYVQQLRARPRLTLWPDSPPMASASEAMLDWLWLSYALVGVATLVAVSGALASAPLWDLGRWRRTLLARGFLARLAGVLALVLCVRGVQAYFASSSPGSDPLRIFLSWNLQGGLTAPGVFYLEHARWYGPAVFLATFSWYPVCRWVHAYGTGLSLALLLAAVFCVNPESRQACNLFTLLVPFCIKRMDQRSWSLAQLSLFAALSLLMSKVWLPLEPRYEALSPIYHYGLYMPDGWYSTHAIGGVVCMLAAFLIFRASGRAGSRGVAATA